MREKTRERMTENKISRMSNFKKKQLSFNYMKQYYASFITKLLKYKICLNSAASVIIWKFCIFLLFLYSANIKTPSLGNVYFLSKF